jgi:hypothetical protein
MATPIDVTEQKRLNEAREARMTASRHYAPNQSQCYVRLPFGDLGDRQWRPEDSIGHASYQRDGSDLQARGLYLDEPPWQARVFSLSKAQ